MRPLPGRFAHAIFRSTPFIRSAGGGVALLQYGAQLSSVDAPKPTCSVLIVEDDQDDVFLLNRAFDDVRRILRRDIKTEHIENGLDALYLVSRQDLTENLPDILVLDLNMPKLDGIKFLTILAAIPGPKGSPGVRADDHDGEIHP